MNDRPPRVYDLQNLKQYASLADYFRDNEGRFDPPTAERLQKVAEAERARRGTQPENCGIVVSKADQKGDFDVFLRVFTIEKAQDMYARELRRAVGEIAAPLPPVSSAPAKRRRFSIEKNKP